MADVARKDLFESAHPDIRETHVNLSGRDLWLEPNRVEGASGVTLPLAAGQPGAFAAFTRYARANKTANPLADYDGARLAASVQTLRVFYGPPPQAPAVDLPLVRATPYPDVAAVAVADKMSMGRGREARLLTHLYFHYPDRVEVSPVLSLAGSQSMDLWGSQLPVVHFHIANLSAQPIARLEVDGQAIFLGDHAFQPESADRCNARNFEAQAIHRLEAPLKVRWQFAQANPAWHEATATVPNFKSAGSPAGRVRATDVELYFQTDGRVLAERSQVIERGAKGIALRTTGLLGELRGKPPCGTARDRYNDNVTIIQD